MKPRLLTPGPTPVPEETLLELAKPVPFHRTPEFRQLRIQLTEAGQLQFRTRNFAGWTATVDGQVVPIREGAVKNILVDLPAGSHLVTLEFRSTPIRRASNWITVVSLLSLFSIVIIATRRK